MFSISIKMNFIDVIDKFHRLEISWIIYYSEKNKLKTQLYDDACKVYGKPEVDADLNYIKAKYEDGEEILKVKPLKKDANQITEANTKTNTMKRLN